MGPESRPPEDANPEDQEDLLFTEQKKLAQTLFDAVSSGDSDKIRSAREEIDGTIIDKVAFANKLAASGAGEIAKLIREMFLK
jgi:hypothetical protein